MARVSDPNITGAEVASQLGGPISTIYRHLPGGRSAIDSAVIKAERSS